MNTGGVKLDPLNKFTEKTEINEASKIVRIAIVFCKNMKNPVS